MAICDQLNPFQQPCSECSLTRYQQIQKGYVVVRLTSVPLHCRSLLIPAIYPSCARRVASHPVIYSYVIVEPCKSTQMRECNFAPYIQRCYAFCCTYINPSISCAISPKRDPADSGIKVNVADSTRVCPMFGLLARVFCRNGCH